MRFSRDRRGQSVVVGTVILFGFLILALGIYQVQVVPTENANVEFEHSQQVEDGFGELRNGVLDAAAAGSARSTQIRLGTRYPSRTFFVNPPPVSGSLATQETGSIRVRNATIGGDPDEGGPHENVRRFWNASPAFETRSLRYDAGYNEFRDAPELVYEHSVVAAEFDDALLLRSGQTVLSDDGRISLAALTGTVSENGVERRSVDARAVSSSDTTVPLAPKNGRITLELPTAVDDPAALATRWEERLPSGATAAADEANGTVRITLANTSDPYRLRLSEVSLDTTGETEPAYIVPVGGESVARGEDATVEVRDRYNNPVSDATVSFNGTTFDAVNRTTNDDGRTTFVANETGALTASINGTSGPEYESVTFDVSEGGAGTRTLDVEWDEIDPVQIEEGTSAPLDILVSEGASSQRIDGAAVDVSFAPRGTVSGRPTVPDPPETDSDGRTTVNEFDTNGASAGDSFDLYASSGDDVDPLIVEVVEPGSATRLYPDTYTATRGTLSNFPNMQDEDGTVAVFDGSGSTGFDVETTTESVPSGDYKLELGVGTVDLQGSSTGIDVVVEDESGAELGSTTLTNADSDTVVSLNLGTIDPQQNVTVRYAADRQNDDLEIDYQRLVEQP
ncbi:Ig-like domain-containing protein [Halorubrum sp. LN27]|uniref:Ig-like domain-containing protein n=1 Tax=Halorubrum sp. LN27 TaxID=2801032 RepID=UPI00190B40C6|nr:Ig-like domain-containing protein [Halorubrum sp. LN27]